MRNYLFLTAAFVVMTAKPQINEKEKLSIERVVEKLSLNATTAHAERLKMKNALIEYDNYTKSFLPSISFSFLPVQFNRSLRLLQNASDGSYSYVEDYSNSSSGGVNIKQKIGITGGEITAGSSLNYLREFSRNRNSFNSTIFNFGYSQSLLGGGKTYRYESRLQRVEKELALKNYCSAISSVQRNALSLYLDAFLNKLESDLSKKDVAINDTLLSIAKLKRQQRIITEYDYNQIELQNLNTRYAERKCKNSMEEAMRKLTTFLNIDSEIELAEPDCSLLPLQIGEIIVMEKVQKNNPQRLEKQSKIIQAQAALHKARLQTTINGTLSINYGANQYAESLTDAYANYNSRQAVSIGFQIPIFGWGINRNKRKIAKNLYESTMMQIETEQKEFDNSIREQINGYNHAINTLKIAELTFVLSKKQYRLAVKKFELGSISVYELTSADKEQYAAMKQYYAAINNLYTSYYALRHLALYDFAEKKDLEDIFIHK